MSEKCVHEWYYRIVDICSWQFFCIRCGEKLSMDKFSDHASDLEKRMAELGKATACIAELEEQVWNLNLENERLEEAYWIDETISPDGTLKPSVRKLLERLEKAETDLRLSDDLVKALDNRIAKLEAENDHLTAQWCQERQDDKCSKPEPNVCEACGGDGTVLLTDGYKGQVIATAKCIYCNGTGRVNKEREE